MNLSLKNTFVLPFESKADFSQWNDNQKYIRNFLTIAPIAALFLCLKNVQIFQTYLPTFGVLFDTLKRSRSEAITFFLLILIFSIGQIFASYLWFGMWDSDFNSIELSSM